MENVLTIRNLTKRFGKLCAVNNLSLTVERGQVFGMLGPNGSGKTTTLGMLMGVINPTAGDYLWLGEKPTHHVRRKIGAVLEHPIFYPYLTGRQNLELMAMIKQAPAANIPRVLELVELAGRENDKYRTYSLGMKQRLALASAMLGNPIILILDEPTNGLDPMGIAEIRGLIQKIALDGKTIILASHLLDEVQKVCTHFAVLKKGSLIHAGPIDDVGKGAEVVEVRAEATDLEGVLDAFPGLAALHRQNGSLHVTLKEGFQSRDLNRFLFENGVVASHLVMKKKNLEQQFLEILGTRNESEPL